VAWPLSELPVFPVVTLGYVPVESPVVESSLLVVPVVADEPLLWVWAYAAPPTAIAPTTPAAAMPRVTAATRRVPCSRMSMT